MKLPQKLERFLDNWPAKVLAFIIALLIYLFYQITVLKTKYIAVPLIVQSSGDIIPAGNITKTVRVSVRGKANEIELIQQEDIFAYLNLDYYTEDGIYNVPVLLETKGNAVMVEPLEIKVKPQSISIELQRRIIGFVPAVVTTTGNVMDGYELTSCVTNPETIRISGPESIVESMKNIQLSEISIEGKNRTFNTEASILNQNKMITVLTEGTVNVTTIIEPLIVDKVFTDIPIITKSIPDNYNITLPSKVVNITIQGAQKIIDNYNVPYGIAYIDCSEIKEIGTYSVPIKVYPQKGLKILKITPESIDIKIEQKEELPIINEVIEEKISNETKDTVQ